jgi:hypothetical protein
MECLIVLLALIVPRFLMVGIFVLTDWFTRAYETTIWPLLGFLFLPHTTLAYMAAMLNNGRLDGWWLILFVLALIVDAFSNSQASQEENPNNQ